MPPSHRGRADVTPARDAPDALARHYGPLVFRAAYRVLGDAAQAEDVQQDVFLRLVEKPPGPVESWAAYLAASASRAAIDALRRRHRWWARLPLLRMQSSASAPSPEAVSLQAEQARQLRAALAALSRREAECFSLRYLEGLDIAEIAHALDVSANTVNVTLHRARRRLEGALTDAMEVAS